jgi:hypothetical protein
MYASGPVSDAGQTCVAVVGRGRCCKDLWGKGLLLPDRIHTYVHKMILWRTTTIDPIPLAFKTSLRGPSTKYIPNYLSVESVEPAYKKETR